MIRTISFACFMSILSLSPHVAQARAFDGKPVSEMSRLDTALVQPVPSRQRASPDLLDRDADGTVSLAEAQAHYSWLFRLLDRDHDRIIHAPEFIEALEIEGRDPARQKAQRERLHGLFQRLDSDGDHAVRRDEFLIACNAHFSSSDGDGDGRISVREFRSRRPL